MSEPSDKTTSDTQPDPAESPTTESEDTEADDTEALSGVWADSDDEPFSDVDDVETPEGETADGDEPDEADTESVTKDEDAEETTPQTPAQPPVPEGFNSWAEVAQAATRARAYEQQIAQQQTPPAQPQAQQKLWTLPGDGNPAVLDAVEILRRAQRGDAAAAEAFKSLPGDVQAKTVERASTLEKRWARYTSDPLALVDDVVLPALEQTEYAKRLRAIEARFARIEGERFLQQHATLVSNEADARRLVELLRVMPNEAEAVRVLGLEKQVAALSRQKSKVDDKSRQIEANKAASRASQNNKGRGPRPTGKAGRIGSTDPKVIAKAVMRRLGG